MKTLEQKIEQAKKLTSILVKVTDKNNTPCERFYFVLKILQDLRIKINEELDKKAGLKTVIENGIKIYLDKEEKITGYDYFAKPELSVTSTTYEKAKKRLEKQIDNRFKRRR